MIFLKSIFVSTFRDKYILGQAFITKYKNHL